MDSAALHLESSTPGLWRYVPVHTGMYRHVLPYTVIEFRMYCHVPPYTAIDCKSTYWYVLLVIWRISVHTGIYWYILNFAKPKSVHTALYYRRVPGSMYRYVPVYTAINQVYMIPDVVSVLFYGTRRCTVTY